MTLRPSVRLADGSIWRSGRPGSSTATWPGPGSASKVTSAVSSGPSSPVASAAGGAGDPGLGGVERPRGERRRDALARLRRAAAHEPRLHPGLRRHADLGADAEEHRQARLDRLVLALRGQDHRQHQRVGIAEGPHPVPLEDLRPRPLVGDRGEVRRARPVELRRDAGVARHPPVGVPPGRQPDLDRRDLRPVAASPARVQRDPRHRRGGRPERRRRRGALRHRRRAGEQGQDEGKREAHRITFARVGSGGP